MAHEGWHTKSWIADKIKEGKKNDPLYPSTDAQIDYIYGPDASDKAMTAVANKNKSKKKYNSPK